MPRESHSSKTQAERARRKAAPKPAQAEATEAARMAQLIAAAEDIFLAKGYHSATMSDVAGAAGMSKKTVYQLIESKADLFMVLLAHHQEKLNIPAARENCSCREILVRNLLCLGQFLLSPQHISIIRLIMAEYTHGRDLGRLFHQNRVKKAKGLLENCLLEFGPPICSALPEAREMATMLFGMALGEFLLTALVGFRPPPTKAMLTRRVEMAVDLFLKGCGAPEQVKGS